MNPARRARTGQTMRFAALAILLACALALDGCNSSGQQSAPTQRAPRQLTAAGSRQGFGNVSAAQRQQFNAMMTQACSGLQQGDPCRITGPSGAMNGTCQQGMNSSLSCRAVFSGRTRGSYGSDRFGGQ